MFTRPGIWNILKHTLPFTFPWTLQIEKIMYRSTKSKGVPSTSRLPRRQIQILASGSTTASCRWMACCLSANIVTCGDREKFQHAAPSWVDFPAQVDAQVHSVLRSHPPEEVVLQMRKQDDTLEIVVMHYVPWDRRAPQGSHRPEPGLRRQLRNAGWVPRGWWIPTWHDWHMRVSMNGDTLKWINDLWVPPFLPISRKPPSYILYVHRARVPHSESCSKNAVDCFWAPTGYLSDREFCTLQLKMRNLNIFWNFNLTCAVYCAMVWVQWAANGFTTAGVFGGCKACYGVVVMQWSAMVKMSGFHGFHSPRLTKTYWKNAIHIQRILRSPWKLRQPA